MTRDVLLSGLVMLFLMFGLVPAEIPQLINYQGMLTTPGGSPVTDGQYNLTFKIYGSESDNDSLWWEYHTNVDVTNGLFNVILGSINPISSSVFDDSLRYLGIKVDTDPELTPRTRLTSVGYAYRARVADSATVAVSAPTGGGWTDDGTVLRLETSSDSVGIGTANPVAKLDVNGDINSDSSYKIQGSTVLAAPDTLNTFVGVNAGINSTGNQGTFVGWYAGYKNQGAVNTFVGSHAGCDNTLGEYNTFVGSGTGLSNSLGNFNTFIGERSGRDNTEGHFNTFLGQSAGVSNHEGSYNTFLGWATGFSCTTGSGNVFIGYASGWNETGSNKLYIANSSADPPLIFGDFSTGKIGLGTINPSKKLTVDGGDAIIKGGDGWDNSGDEAVLYLGDPNHGISSVYDQGVRIWTYDDVNHDIRFRGHTGTDYLTIEMSSGNVGIGTTAPDRRLHIKGDNPRILIEATSVSPEINFKNSDDVGTETWALYKHGTTDDFRFYQSGDKVTIQNSTGNVGIGTTDPGQKLDVNGIARIRSWGATPTYDVQVNNDGDLCRVSSSKRYKKNIRRLESDLDKVLDLQPVSFEWKTTSERDIGLIAEDVHELIPELVGYDKEGRPDAVKYDKVAIYLLEVVKVQQERISALEKEMAELKD